MFAEWRMMFPKLTFDPVETESDESDYFSDEDLLQNDMGESPPNYVEEDPFEHDGNNVPAQPDEIATEEGTDKGSIRLAPRREKEVKLKFWKLLTSSLVVTEEVVSKAAKQWLARLEMEAVGWPSSIDTIPNPYLY